MPVRGGRSGMGLYQEESSRGILESRRCTVLFDLGTDRYNFFCFKKIL